MSNRPAMVASEIREKIAPALRLCPPKCGMVSITKVDVSPDLGYVTIWISALMHPELALEFLQGQGRELRQMLKPLELRKIPSLRFKIDRQGEEAARIDELLR